MTVEELRNYLNDLIESGQKDKEVVIKYCDFEFDCDRYEHIKQINTEKTNYEELDAVALEGGMLA